MLRLVGTGCLLVWVALVSAQLELEVDPFAASFIAENITAGELQSTLEVIASDEFEGRETGTEGQEKAASYIVDQMRALGLVNAGALKNYRQSMVFSTVRWEDASIQVDDQEYEHMRDFLCFQDQNTNLPNLKVDDVLFLGYGIDDEKYSDYRKAKARGKVVMIYKGEPRDKDSISYITGSKEASPWSGNIDMKLRTAAEHKVRLVLIVDPDLRKNISANRGRIMRKSLSIERPRSVDVPNHIFISVDLAKKIIGEKENNFRKNQLKIVNSGAGRPLHLPVNMRVNQHIIKNAVYSSNLIGVLPGIDPALSDEVVVVSAHYDHLGKRGEDIYNGADDNGSGTTAVLEIMETLKEAHDEGIGPRRTVMAVFFTGEEKGLLGSQYYSEHPIIPFDQTVVDVNVDMIGRVDRDHTADPHYIYVIGSDRLSTDLHAINEATNATFTHLALDYKYNAKDDPNRIYYRSDHYNFAKHGIPSIFYFSGVHEDYHRPTDTVEKINYNKFTAVTRHIFHTVLELANRDERIVVDVDDDTTYDR